MANSGTIARKVYNAKRISRVAKEVMSVLNYKLNKAVWS